MMQDWELAPTRCPLCDGGLQAERVHRFLPAGGRWLEHSKVHWFVRCPNGHTGEGDTLAAAIENASRQTAD